MIEILSKEDWYKLKEERIARLREVCRTDWYGILVGSVYGLIDMDCSVFEIETALDELNPKLLSQLYSDALVYDYNEIAALIQNSFLFFKLDPDHYSELLK